MTPISFQKERLTMASTGRKRFWLGVVEWVSVRENGSA